MKLKFKQIKLKNERKNEEKTKVFKYEMIRSFGDNICICDITILIGLEQYLKKVRIQNVLSLYKGRELTLNGFKN